MNNSQKESRAPDTELIIIGAGAAGLMAAATAGEYGIRTCVVERRHLPGRKLLMCGNNRCNITREIAVDEMLEDLGEPVAPFVSHALQAFGPTDLRRWFGKHQLKTRVNRNNKVYPASEKADDVLHCFQDRLREDATPIILNAAVTGIQRCDEIWHVETPSLRITASHILIATGGVSYPKTGSVGDGQKFARSQGHHIEPYRPGLAGYNIEEPWINELNDLELTSIRLLLKEGSREIGITEGDLIFTRWGLRGGAFVDGCRLCSRLNRAADRFEIDLLPTHSASDCIELLSPPRNGRKQSLGDLLTQFFPAPFIRRWLAEETPLSANRPLATLSQEEREKLSSRLKCWKLTPTSPRPLKEAMVTIGGIRISEIDPLSMASEKRENLWFAGEVLDIDGPTGGYNLQMAFSTARLAVTSIAKKLGREKLPEKEETSRRQSRRKPYPKPRRGNTGQRRKFSRSK